MKPTFLALAGGVALAAAPLTRTASAVEPSTPASSEPLIQIAILLDTSGSMSGLIEQAKGQLWKIVNEFIFARQDDRRPRLEVALYEYGKSSLTADSGWVRQIVPLSDDLDKISQELFALRTNGGEEYCGWVIRDATRDLQWSDDPEVYKAVFIAGNEPFTQGPVDYAESCRSAIQRGIVVNTIHCGPRAVGIQTQWQQGALLADGKYMVIEQDRAVVHFEAPQDGEIARLSAELNTTYLPYGAAGAAGFRNLIAQDSNAASLSSQGAEVQRAVTKSSRFYRNSNWDLADAFKADPQVLGRIDESELPKELRDLPAEERAAFIREKAREREAIQAKIQELNQARRRHVAESARAGAASSTLDAAVIGAVREQAQAKGFRFEEASEPNR